GVSLSRQTMANWIIHVADKKLVLIYEQMRLKLLKEPILHADETTLQVLNEPGRDAPPIILFDYQQTRAGKHPNAFLKGFKGYLHTDGYAGYNGLLDVTLVGCWAHARREFVNAIKALPAKDTKNPILTLAKEGLQFCNELF